MRRSLSWCAGWLALLGICGMALAAPAVPTLFAINAAKPVVSAQGAEQAWPIRVSEEQAMTAVFAGGMWLPDPEGGRIYAKYQRHILHPDGVWTWIGTVATVHGDQSVTLTFGKGGVVFGDIPQVSGRHLQVSTVQNQTRIIATDARVLARLPGWVQAHSQADYLVPPAVAHPGGMQAAPASPRPAPASASSPATIDLMVAYTTGLVQAYGSESTTLTRIQFLVDWANQAYVSSKVYQQLRLVHTVEVDYPDSSTAQVALNDLTPGQAKSSAASALAQIPSLRQQYGADLVLMLSAANDARGTGLGWLNGAGGSPLSAQWGYAVDCDIPGIGFPAAVACPTLDFAHELGHDMGNAHDRATSAGDGDGQIASGGAYAYSYGYKNSTEGFATIMAYADSNETYLQVFSNPDISTCMNFPCGVADSSPDSADNAHSMNNTAPIIAAFEPTMVGAAGAGQLMMARNDVNGDGNSDLLWMNAGAGSFGYWTMDGGTVTSVWSTAVASGYQIVATGDFNDDGEVDLVWTSAAHDLYLWESDGTGFKSYYVGTYPAGWEVVGAGDVDGDGKSDLLWFNPGTSTFGYWLMNGPSVVGGWSTQVPSGWQVGALADFNNDGRTDIVWRDPSGNLTLWLGNGASFTSLPINMGNAMATAGTLIGAGYVASNNWDTPELLFLNTQSHVFSYYDIYVGGGQAYQYANWSASVAPGYSIAAVGDFNGDGRTGIVWTSAAQDLYLWEGTDAGFSSAYLGTYPAGWTVIPSQLMSWSAKP